MRELPREALAGTAARLWLSLPPEARKGTIVLAPTHEMREEINATIRRGLADEGALGRRSIEIGRLVDRRLTRVHAAEGANYRPGDIVVANRDVYGLGEGEAWTVTGMQDGAVNLERRGAHRAFKPSGNAARNVSLCEERALPLRAGDEIVWTRNVRRRGTINGERATVEKITPKRVHVRMHSGRTIRFAHDDDDLRHIDHAWSSTVHRAQGITTNNVIAVLDSAGMMSDRAMLYVEMSRARDGFVLLTDDTEQLVSRLEREGQSVSSALEAAGEAPWLEPDVGAGVAEKPPMWPVRAEWRAHVERAQELNVPPFHLDGCDALIARMERLAKKEALPDDLAAVLKEHEPFAGDRAGVAEWHSAMLQRAGERERLLAEAAGGAVTDLRGYAAWRKRAAAVIARGDGLLADEGRYGVHLDRVAGEREQAGAPLDGLRRALGVDRDAAALLIEWRALEKEPAKLPPDGLEGRIAALADRATPGEMPGALLSAPGEIAERRRREAEAQRRQEEGRQRQEQERLRERQAARLQEEAETRKRAAVERDARERLPVLEALTGERDRLLGAALLDRVAGLPDWRDRAEEAAGAARESAGDPSLPAGLRAALAESAGEIERALAFDRDFAALWRAREDHYAKAREQDIHPFHAPGSGDIAGRIAALAERAARPDEVPERLAKALEEHRMMAREWQEIERRRDELAHLAANPDPESEVWRADARRAAADTKAILADERMCRDHGLTGTVPGREIADNAETLNGELRIHDASEELLRDWQAHAEAAEREGIHPFHAPGYGDLVERIESHAGEAGKRTPAVLAQALKDHARLDVSWREARGLRDRLDACTGKRDELLDRAGEGRRSAQPVSDLGLAHRRWKGGVRPAIEAGRTLLDDEHHAAHLDALGGRARIERSVARLEKADLLDRLPARTVRAWEALEDRLRETDSHRFFLPEHKRACRLMPDARSIKNVKARAFVGNELRLRERMSEETKQLDDAVGKLRDCQARREAAEAGETPVRAAGGLRVVVGGRLGRAPRREAAARQEEGLRPALRARPGPRGRPGDPDAHVRGGAAGGARAAAARARGTRRGGAPGTAPADEPGPRLQDVTAPPAAAAAPDPWSVEQAVLAGHLEEVLGDRGSLLLPETLDQHRRHLTGPPGPDQVQDRREHEEPQHLVKALQRRAVLLRRAGHRPPLDARDPVPHLALLVRAPHQPRRRRNPRPSHRAAAPRSARARPGSATSTTPPRPPVRAPAPSRGPSPRPSEPSAPGSDADASSPPPLGEPVEKGHRVQHRDPGSRHRPEQRLAPAVEGLDPPVLRPLLLLGQREHGVGTLLPLVGQRAGDQEGRVAHVRLVRQPGDLRPLGRGAVDAAPPRPAHCTSPATGRSARSLSATLLAAASQPPSSPCSASRWRSTSASTSTAVSMRSSLASTASCETPPSGRRSGPPARAQT